MTTHLPFSPNSGTRSRISLPPSNCRITHVWLNYLQWGIHEQPVQNFPCFHFITEEENQEREREGEKKKKKKRNQWKKHETRLKLVTCFPRFFSITIDPDGILYILGREDHIFLKNVAFLSSWFSVKPVSHSQEETKIKWYLLNICMTKKTILKIS